jgi:starvation-inducible DNA-binding protein
MEMDIGIAKADREKIATTLSRVLADTYVLYLKTHAYHWNEARPYRSLIACKTAMR